MRYRNAGDKARTSITINRKKSLLCFETLNYRNGDLITTNQGLPKSLYKKLPLVMLKQEH